MGYSTEQRKQVLDDLRTLDEQISKIEDNFARDDYYQKLNSENNSDKKNYSVIESAVNILPSLAFISFLTMLIMSFYEIGKQLLIPNLSVWESHLITIIFSGIVAPIAAYYVLRRMDSLHNTTLKEIESRKSAEKELQKYQLELENRVRERTRQLFETNEKLRKQNEITRRVDNALQNSEQRYKHLFDSSPVGIFNYNKEMRITDFNRHFAEIIGQPDIKIKNIKIDKISDGRVLPTLMKVFGGKSGYYEGEYFSTNSDEERTISLRTAPFYDNNKNITGGIAIIENITDRIMAKETLFKAKEEAERSSKLKSEFLATMSHEVRTPINTILSFTSLIREDVKDIVSEDLIDSFGSITKAGKRIIRTMDLILNMSELHAGTYDYTPTDFNLFTDVIAEVFHNYKTEAKEKNLDFILVRETNDTIINADSYALKQIMENLIDNAVKYTNQGKIEIKVYRDNHNLIVEVADTGIGISEAYQKELFTPFSQEEQGYTRKFEGNGIGLALAKQLADLNSIIINAESTKNFGSTFRLILPPKILRN